MKYLTLGDLRFNFGSDKTEDEIKKATEFMRKNDHLIFDVPAHVNCRRHFINEVN